MKYQNFSTKNFKMEPDSVFLKKLCVGHLPYPLSARINIGPSLLTRLIQSEEESTEQFQIKDLIGKLWEIEPLMEMETFFSQDGIDFLRWCKASGTTVTLTCPLFKLSRERAEILIDCSVDRLTLLLDNLPSRREVERKFWEKAAEVISELKAAQKERGSELPLVRLQISGTEADLPGLGEVVRLAARMEIGEVIVLPADSCRRQSFKEALSLARKPGVRIHSGGVMPEDAYLPDGANIAARPRETAMSSSPGRGAPSASRLKQWIKKLLSREIPPDSLVDISRLRPASRQRKACLFPWNRTCVNEEGKVTVCPVSRRIMGDLKKQTFADIWNGADYAGFRARLLSPYPMEECRRCVFRGWFQPWEVTDWLWTGVNDQFGVQLGAGWYERERGLPYRWSRREAFLRLKNPGKKKLALVFHLPLRKLAQDGEILINGVKSGVFRLKKRGDSFFYFPISLSAGEELIVSIIAANPIIPHRFLSNNDWRRLGFAFKGAFFKE